MARTKVVLYQEEDGSCPFLEWFSGLPAKIENGKLAAATARRARLDEHELANLLARCEGASSGDEVSESELLKLVTRIREIESQIGA